MQRVPSSSTRRRPARDSHAPDASSSRLFEHVTNRVDESADSPRRAATTRITLVPLAGSARSDATSWPSRSATTSSSSTRAMMLRSRCDARHRHRSPTSVACSTARDRVRAIVLTLATRTHRRAPLHSSRLAVEVYGTALRSLPEHKLRGTVASPAASCTRWTAGEDDPPRRGLCRVRPTSLTHPTPARWHSQPDRASSQRRLKLRPPARSTRSLPTRDASHDWATTGCSAPQRSSTKCRVGGITRARMRGSVGDALAPRSRRARAGHMETSGRNISTDCSRVRPRRGRSGAMLVWADRFR